MDLEKLNNIIEKLTDQTTCDKIKVFGSALFFDNPRDYDIAVYDLKIGFKIADAAKKEGIRVHIVPMKKIFWDDLRNVTTFNNTAAEYYKGEIHYGDNYTDSKVLSPNNNSIPVFSNFSTIMRTRNKLLDRGFVDSDEDLE